MEVGECGSILSPPPRLGILREISFSLGERSVIIERENSLPIFFKLIIFVSPRKDAVPSVVSVAFILVKFPLAFHAYNFGGGDDRLADEAREGSALPGRPAGASSSAPGRDFLSGSLWRWGHQMKGRCTRRSCGVERARAFEHITNLIQKSEFFISSWTRHFNPAQPLFCVCKLKVIASAAQND